MNMYDIDIGIMNSHLNISLDLISPYSNFTSICVWQLLQKSPSFFFLRRLSFRARSSTCDSANSYRIRPRKFSDLHPVQI